MSPTSFAVNPLPAPINGSTLRAIARRARAGCLMLILSGVAGSAAANPIVITATVGAGTNAAGMVAALIGANPGVGLVAGSEVYTGKAAASGLFTGATGILPFDSGIALTTGAASLVPGPNNKTNAGVNNAAPGDAALTAMIGSATFDASVLTFRFVPTLDTISFQYLFGSEEYNEFVGSPFNDVFAFFLNGQNVALIPGTGTPVAINSVNSTVNSSYFTNNSGGGLNIQYDGLVGATTSLLATGHVTPGVENTISINIADVGDRTYDSGVLLAANSFVNFSQTNTVAAPAPVPEPGTFVLLGTGLLLSVRGWRRRTR